MSSPGWKRCKRCGRRISADTPGDYGRKCASIMAAKQAIIETRDKESVIAGGLV